MRLLNFGLICLAICSWALACLAIGMALNGCGLATHEGHFKIPLDDGRCEVYFSDTPDVGQAPWGTGPLPTDRNAYNGAECVIGRW